MPCRVGITTDPASREQGWRNRVNGFKNWLTHGFHWNKSDAQEEEDRRVAACNASGTRGTCYGKAGGGDPNAHGWTVYSFDYSSDPGR